MSCSMFISLEGNVLRVVMMMTRFLYGFDCYELVFFMSLIILTGTRDVCPRRGVVLRRRRNTYTSVPISAHLIVWWYQSVAQG